MPTWKRGALWTLATSVLLAIAAGGKPLVGQGSSDTSRSAEPAVDQSWPEVNLNVVVLDKHGAPQTVDEHQFQLFEDGAERPPQFRGSPDSPISIGFIIDTSGSMFRRLGSTAWTVKAIVKALPEGSEVMAVLFGDEAHLDLPFTPISKADLSFLDRRSARGGTALFDALVVTEQYFAAHARYARRALVLFSDGGDDASHSREKDAIRSLQSPGAPTFYSFNFPDPWPPPGGKHTMDLLAKAGGGVAFAPKEKDLEPEVTRLISVIPSQYVLRFTAADAARDGKAHKLEVRLSDRTLQILALPVYYAPSQ